MTKEAFFGMRDKQGQAGLRKDYQPKTCQNDLLKEEEQRAIAALNGQKSGVFKTADIGFTGLLCVETYIGKAVKVCRRKIDELDNVTIWKY